jgi:hypothetical protein
MMLNIYFSVQYFVDIVCPFVLFPLDWLTVPTPLVTPFVNEEETGL